MSITRPFAKPGSGSDNELSFEEFFSQFYIYLDLLDLFIQLFLIKEMIKKKETLVPRRYWLMSFLMQTNFFFYNEQFGFLSGRSTSHALVHVVDFVSRAINNEQYCVGVFLDVKKA